MRTREQNYFKTMHNLYVVIDNTFSVLDDI